MNNENLRKHICAAGTSMVDAMQKIDNNAHGILFVVEQDGKLSGSVTDGDIRRWIIKTGDLKAPISKAMNTKPKVICQRDRVQAQQYMKDYRITAVPVIDVQGKLCDIYLSQDFALPENTECNNSLAATKVIIMAGGAGTRLYPYTKILPKPLIPIGDVPIVERIINRFCRYGIKDYYLTVNYKKNMIRSYFQELEPDYHITYVEEDKPLGTAGSIRLIQDPLAEPVFVTNCDILVNANYHKIMQYHKESGNAITVVSALKNVTVPYGVLHSSQNGVITSMEEKPHLSYFINTGMYVLDPQYIDRIPEDTMFHMPQLAELLMQEGKQVGMYPVSEDSFLDMGEFEEMKRMEEKLELSKE